MRLAMKCQIIHQKSKDLQTQHKDGLHAEQWSLPTTSQLEVPGGFDGFIFFLGNCLCLSDHASTTSTVQQWLVATYNFAASPFLHFMISTRSVLSADIQDPNSNAIATQYCNIAIAIYLGKCVPTCSNRWLCQDAESICLQSSLLDCFSQGSKRLSTASQAVSNILSGETAFRQDEDNVESFSWKCYAATSLTSGSVMRLPVSTPGLVQQLLWFIQFFSSVSTGRFIDIITKQSFFQISITR